MSDELPSNPVYRMPPYEPCHAWQAWLSDNTNIATKYDDVRVGAKVIVLSLHGYVIVEIDHVTGHDAVGKTSSSVYMLSYDAHGWSCWGGGSLAAIKKLRLDS